MTIGLGDTGRPAWRRWYAWIGLVTLTPALLIVVGGLFHLLLGLSGLSNAIADPATAPLGYVLAALVQPPVVVGGVLAALILNGVPAIHARRDPATGIFRLQLTWRGSWINHGVALAGGIAGAVLFAYLLVENFQIIAR